MGLAVGALDQFFNEILGALSVLAVVEDICSNKISDS